MKVELFLITSTIATIALVCWSSMSSEPPNAGEKILATRSLGPFGPLLLAPAEGFGAFGPYVGPLAPHRGQI